jgi:hypothetical protein
MLDGFLNDGNDEGFDINEFLKRILKMKDSISNDSDNFGDLISTETFDEDGFTFEKKTFMTQNGKLTIIDMISTPFGESINKKIPLDIQLNKAVEDERYEDAARIRDLINIEKEAEEDKWNF